MLGLLGAHMLLDRREPQLGLLTEVLINLGRLLGPHPDISALVLMSSRRFGNELPLQGMVNHAPEFPPVLRAGVNAMLDAEWNSLKPANLGSLDAAARYHLLPEEPWTFFWKKSVLLRQTAVGRAESDAETDVKLMRSPKRPSMPQLEPMFHLERSEAVLRSRLRAFVKQVQEKNGLEGVLKLKPEHLRWTGLKPERVTELLKDLTRYRG
jgi:hypothetical protein